MGKPPLSGSDDISFSGFVNDLTYAEIHATTWGFALAAAYVLTQSPVFATAYFGLLAYAVTGSKTKAKSLGVDVPESVYRQVKREAHYFNLGGVLGYVGLTAARHFGYTVQIPF